MNAATVTQEAISDKEPLFNCLLWSMVAPTMECYIAWLADVGSECGR